MRPQLNSGLLYLKRKVSNRGLGIKRGRGVDMDSLGSRNIDVITLFVEDLERSKLFYQNVFGLAVVFEDKNSAVFNFGNMSINLLKTPAAHELINPGTVASQESGSRFQFTIHVDDVDEVCTELTARGVKPLNGPMDRAWGVRTVSFADPGGHIWEVAQQLPR
jgi:catechol 2,3-dioxygenase-like lactoylglutathione lyase family enzyme